MHFLVCATSVAHTFLFIGDVKMRKIISVLLVAILVFTLSACSNKNTDSSITTQSEISVKPKNYTSVLLVSINPQFKLYLDADNNVLAVEPINDDAETFSENIDFKNKSVEVVIENILEQAHMNGFIEKNVTVLFEITEQQDDANNNILTKAVSAAQQKAEDLKIEIKTQVKEYNKIETTENKKPTATITSSELTSNQDKNTSSEKETGTSSSSTESKKPTTTVTSSELTSNQDKNTSSEKETDTTSNTTESKKPTATSKPTETIIPDHKHNYSSLITVDATCDKSGLKTFTCHCGHSYTEKIAATGHEYNEWKQTAAPSYTAKGQETRTCKKCSNSEKREIAQLSLDSLFEEYTKTVIKFNSYFNSTNELSNITSLEALSALIDHSRGRLVEPIDIKEIKGEYGDYETCMTFDIRDFDKFTLEHFGYTWDYSTLDGKIIANMYECSYNKTKNTLSLTAPDGWGGPSPWAEYKGYTKIDSTHFIITYDYKFEGEILFNNVKIEVELINDKYIIIAHYK